MRRVQLREVAWVCSLAAVMALGAMPLHAGGAGMSDVHEPVVLSGDGPWQRFIVKYRAGSAPRETRDNVAGRLAATVDRAGLGKEVVLRWERRLGIGADLVVADRRLDRESAQRLLDAFAADPDVEYAEPDAMMQHAPAVPGAMPGAARGD